MEVGDVWMIAFVSFCMGTVVGFLVMLFVFERKNNGKN